MEILNYTDIDKEIFETFTENEWRIADAEHYGDNPPDFTEIVFTLLAKHDGQIVGQIKCDVSQGVAKIDSLLVAKDQQGRGVGSSLLQAAEKQIKELGAHKVSLETGVNWSAKDFYEKNGYIVRAILPNDVAGQDFVLMDKMVG